MKEQSVISKENNNIFYNMSGKNIVIVGSSSVRVLESVTQQRVGLWMDGNNQIMDSEVSGESILSVMVRVSKEQYDLVVLNLDRVNTDGQLTEISRWKYDRYIRESWPLFKLIASAHPNPNTSQQDDCLAGRITEANQTLQLFRYHLYTNKMHAIADIPFQLDHFQFLNYNKQLFIITVLEQHHRGYEVTKASIQIYQFDHQTDHLNKILDQEFPSAEEIVIKKSSDSECIMIKTQVHVDETNQSYYGQNQLYHYGFRHKQLKQIELYEGPVHSFEFI